MRQARFFFFIFFSFFSFFASSAFLFITVDYLQKTFYVFALCLLAPYKGLTELCLHALKAFFLFLLFVNTHFHLWIHFCRDLEANSTDAFLCGPHNAWKWAPRHAKYVCVACEWRTLSSFFLSLCSWTVCRHFLRIGLVCSDRWMERNKCKAMHS